MLQRFQNQWIPSGGMQVIEAENFLEEELIAADSRITEVAMPWWPEEGEVRLAREGGEEGDGLGVAKDRRCDEVIDEGLRPSDGDGAD